MADNETGGNGSVHWKVTLDDPPGVGPAMSGYDPLGGAGFEGIGSRYGKRHAEQFMVTLRFPNAKAAKKALTDAIAGISVRKKGAFAQVRVKAINRPSPSANLPYEVKVSW